MTLTAQIEAEGAVRLILDFVGVHPIESLGQAFDLGAVVASQVLFGNRDVVGGREGLDLDHVAIGGVGFKPLAATVTRISNCHDG